MRTYRVVINIASTDRGPAERTEVTHNVSADSLADLLAHANKVIATFAKTDPIAVHERLVSEQNKEIADGEPDSEQPADDYAGDGAATS